MANTKILHIVRHAKSSWDYDDISDIDRPLMERGINDAHKMGRRLKKRESVPGVIFSSPANRALHTATIIARELDFPFDQFHIDPILYEGGETKILQLVRQIDDRYSEAMITGHNPDFTYLANSLTKQGIDKIPTCGIVSIEFAVDSWSAAGSHNVVNETMDYPKKK